MEHRIENEASKNKVTYMSGKPKKDKVDDFSYYLDIQIYSMADEIGVEQTILYLKDKIKKLQSRKGGK